MIEMYQFTYRLRAVLWILTLLPGFILPQDITQVTFIVDDTADEIYAPGYRIHGSWNYSLDDSTILVYDASWTLGQVDSNRLQLFDDGTYGDTLAGDHVWTRVLRFICDYGATTYRYGVCNHKGGWITEGPSFTLPDTTPQTLIWFEPAVSAVVTFNFHDVYGLVLSTAPEGAEPHITIPGSFNGWDEVADTLHSIGGDVYSITLGLSIYETYSYKYYINGEWNLVQSENRTITITSAEMVVDDYPIDIWPTMTLVSHAAQWKYNNTGADLGTDWVTLDYDDSGWSSGYGVFGHGNGDEITVTAEIPTATYFRIKFEADPILLGSIYLTTAYDDGFVAYLNGTEIDRENMPAGTVSYNTYALGGENAMKFLTPVDKALLDSGANVLAVSVHNRDATPTGDIRFDAALSYETVPVELDTLIAWGEEWKYDDSGADLGSDWTGPGFDDSGWPSGPAPLGYGNDEVVTTTTQVATATYFRKSFTVSNVSAYSFLAWDAWKDDGVVVYLNGTEVLRGNMPTGTISYDSYAVGSEHSHVTLETDASLLVDGENVVAVSLHNKDSDVTGDRSLDLHLVGKRVVLSVDSDPGGLTPQAYRLFQNYPNPFNPATTIRYSISRGGYVNLSLYDLTGRLVNTLVSEQRTPGEHAVRWNGINASGRAVSSGIYLYRLEVNGVVLTRRMVFIK